MNDMHTLRVFTGHKLYKCVSYQKVVVKCVFKGIVLHFGKHQQLTESDGKITLSCLYGKYLATTSSQPVYLAYLVLHLFNPKICDD